MIRLTKPLITEDLKAEVCAVLESGYLTEGQVAADFEQALADFAGSAHAVAVTSCTVGLEMALRVAGIGPGDEVLVPDYTYPATATAVVLAGATAVVVDVDRDTMLMDLDATAAAVTGKTRAIMPVPQFGNPMDYDRLQAIKQKHGLLIIEDAAPALGAEYQGKRVGSLCDMSVFSFHPRKTITTGEGGAITTDNAEWAEWLTSYKHFGLEKVERSARAEFARIGGNYKLSDVLAAIGLAQMKQADGIFARRRELAARYAELLTGDERIGLPRKTAAGLHSYQTFCVFVDNRDEIMRQMREQGIEVQIGTYALHRQPAMHNSSQVRLAGDYPGSSTAFERCLALPLYHELSAQDQELVVGTFKELI